MPEIWVYGTLRQGMPADMLMRGARFRGLGWLNRVQLADLGTYPGLIEGGPGVLGELYQVTPRHLKALDQYEDCFPDRPDASLYFRRSVRVRRLADGQPVTVDAYFYALKRPAPRVEVPCYRVHCHPRDSLQYLLCYGSNMSRKRLEDRVGPVQDLRTAWLPGYRLAFNKTAFDGNGTVANAVWTGRPEDRLPVRIATLTPDQLHIMDGFERAPAHYLRTLVDVPLNGDRTLPCHIYLGHPDRLGEGRPSEAYLQHIVTGYAEAGLEPPDPSAGY